ncbi:HAD family hydrolase [Arcobacter caeni]|uniref:phosphoglycolate phosphatase n=1 Tax=Arcobacter caeni TaxID=1912877 RepID=A0A363CWT3_9BACT|nr:HAD family hydrolase [Arcobacter caeni]
MVAGKKTIIFDLDGTLIDSIEDIAVCMNKVLEKLNLPIYEIKDYKYFVGSGVDVLVENALKGSSQEIKNEVLKGFKKEYDQKLHTNTKPYEGIYELLDELKKLNYNLAVLSNKPHDFTVAYVDYLFKDYGFIEVHGQKKEIPRKPDPIGAINIATALNIPCEEIFFVGDTMVDMQTAKSAKMKAIGVLWGFRDEEELLTNGADFIVKHPLDILKVIHS